MEIKTGMTPQEILALIKAYKSRMSVYRLDGKLTAVTRFTQAEHALQQSGADLVGVYGAPAWRQWIAQNFEPESVADEQRRMAL